MICDVFHLPFSSFANVINKFLYSLSSQKVGYKVCLEGQRGRDTRLLFCTIGILSRRLLHDKSLKGFTHVIVDNIHEHGMNEELRLILMSATLNAELFLTYFGGAPMIYIPELVKKDDAGNVIVQCKSNWLHFITVYLQEVNGKMMLLVVDIPRGSRWN
ncbi:hypothetical protein C5167_001290 [Papaver somniferum]|uniref:Helicase ATP-binding domain-containing protein n=1 Tax=Papaver somniferum TaxID=3469 RepID=A0A4Y7KU14_PAPSO|nr:hypothetical protein C5167_001290 [Papaver somniferum]